MKHHFNNTTYLLLVPLITFGVFVFFAVYFNNSYFIDPDYVYLINGLNIFRGESYAIYHVDHPGTPLQVLIGICISIIGTLRGAEDITTDVLSNPQFYIKSIIIFIAFLHSLIVFLIGRRYYKHQNNIVNTILLQSSFLLFDTVSNTYMKLFPDTIIPLGSLLIILITIEKVWGKMKDRTFSFLSGLVLGVFMAIKITFLPLAIIPFIITSKWKNKILVPVYAGIFFLISILPVIDKFSYFRSFIFKIATHEGTYGEGNEEIINMPKLLHNIWDIFQMNYTFTLIFVLQLIFLIFIFYRKIFKNRKNNDFRILIALFASIVLQLVLVSKQVSFRYMIPTLLISSFALTIILNQLKSLKVVYFSIFILLLLSAVYYNYKMLSGAFELKWLRNKSYSFIQKTIQPDDALLIVSKDSWMGSPFISHSLMFGKLYCYRQGEQYADVLEGIYPNHYFWTHNIQQFSSWRLAEMPDLILNQHKKLYLYIQTDNPLLYPGILDDFTTNMKYYDKDSVNLTLLFSNPRLDEEFYLVSLQNAKFIKPKHTIHSSFEKKADSVNDYILISNDSISFESSNRFSEQHSFEGKNSICLKPDNPYGIPVTIPHLKQHDYVHISIMCKRSSKRDECIVGIKSVIPDEGLITAGSNSTEVINGWEKLEFSYRFNKTPAEQKAIMFIWNNSTEPVYFDNLMIEVY